MLRLMKIEAEVRVLRSTVEAIFLKTTLKSGWSDHVPETAEDRQNCCNLEAMLCETPSWSEAGKRMYLGKPSYPDVAAYTYKI